MNTKVVIKDLSNEAVRLRLKVLNGSGNWIFLKINYGGNPHSHARDQIIREKAALTILNGLAVPDLVDVNKSSFKSLVHGKPFWIITTEWCTWKSSRGRKFSTSEALGIWLFCLEQFCAMRRCGLLYTDVKADNVLVSRAKNAAKIIDFDYCTLRVSSDRYKPDIFSAAFFYSPPERFFSRVLSERAVIYQIGMLLGNLLAGEFRNHDINHKKNTLMSKLANARTLYKIFLKSISYDYKKRSKNIECLFRSVIDSNLPQKAIQHWCVLRGPYTEKLTSLGFQDPRKLLRYTGTY